MTTTTKKSLDIGLGSFCTLGLETLELLAQPPMNFVLLDAQHGSWSLEQLKHGVRAAEAMGVLPVIRLPVAGQWMIETLLDAGCTSFLFPMINTPQQAEEASRACYYPPMGLRSQSTCRAHLRHGSNYRQIFNDMFNLRVMIEHVDAVNSIDAILDVPGIMYSPDT